MLVGALATTGQRRASGAGGAQTLNVGYFDGTNDYAYLNDNLGSDTNTFTYSYWIKFDSGDDTYWHRHFSTPSNIVLLGRHDSKFRVNLRTSPSIRVWDEYSNTTPVESDGWLHVMGSRSGTTTHMYVNGSDDGQGPLFSTSGNTNFDSVNGLYIGRADSSVEYFTGYMYQMYVSRQYIDLSSSSNRAIFYNNGLPTDLSGAPSAEVIVNDPSTGVNSGTLGNFTVYGITQAQEVVEAGS